MSLEIQSRRRTRRGINEPGFHPSLQGERGRHREVAGIRKERQSASTAETGEPEPRDPDLRGREGLYLEEELLGKNLRAVHRDHRSTERRQIAGGVSGHISD